MQCTAVQCKGKLCANDWIQWDFTHYTILWMHYALLKWGRVSLTSVDWDNRLHTNNYQNDRKVGRRSQGKTANTASSQKEIPSLSPPSPILDLLHCNAENGCKVEDDILEKKSREQNRQHWRVFKRMRSNKCSGEFDRARWKSLLEKEHRCDNGLGEKSNIPIPPDSNSWINLHPGWSVLPGRRPERGPAVDNLKSTGRRCASSNIWVANPKEISENINSG